MSVVFILLPLALLFVAIALAWFIWAVRSGQFDDLETPAVRMLFDDESTKRSTDNQGGVASDAAVADETSTREVEVR